MPKKKAHELTLDPKYITVHTDDRYISGPTARVISKKLLRRIVSEKCEIYKAGECNECFTESQELEYPCISAWKMTVGKGQKLY
ncbi:hypothetical protein HUB98_05785 [Paenibacillus barcinonensis]|uniref:Uncharacterized protein n=1 Tax=Paenibacillus barcinonensis TaxID=198119 RepID=A0A2V4VD93_PAEBA|nr:hypothetical protein [Paenibacillus barcinonensis]PYE51508.1 hypothetical protein DFQ00_102302 [Paenibacillus barcinonensis]QKS55891.1 hypothetical protein HUB98_05785 [Paenibacillus barcinonensis]